MLSIEENLHAVQSRKKSPALNSLLPCPLATARALLSLFPTLSVCLVPALLLAASPAPPPSPSSLSRTSLA